MDTIKLYCQSSELIPFTNNLAWSSDKDTLGIQLTFDTFKELKEGAVVSRYNNDVEVFRGVIIKKTQHRWYSSYTCLDYSFYLKNKDIKQFNGMAASEAIKSMLGEAYIQSDICDIPTIINQIYFDKSLSEIIDDILDQAQKDQGVTYFKELNANILTIKKLSDMIITPQIILPKDISIDSTIEDMKNKIIIITKESDNATVLATAEDTSNQDFYGVLVDTQSVDDKEKAQAQNIADNLLKEKNKINYQTSLNLMAIKDAESIRANRLIYLKAGSRLDGYYKIKSASHTVSKGTHKVSISLEW